MNTKDFILQLIESNTELDEWTQKCREKLGDSVEQATGNAQEMVTALIEKLEQNKNHPALANLLADVAIFAEENANNGLDEELISAVERLYYSLINIYPENLSYYFDLINFLTNVKEDDKAAKKIVKEAYTTVKELMNELQEIKEELEEEA